MMRLAAAALAVLLASLPVAMWPSSVVATAAAASLGLALTGVAMRLSPLVTAGVSLGWVAYLIALAAARPGLDVASAIAMGTGSFLLLESVDFAGRFHAVPLPRRVIVAQVRWWLLFCLAVAGLVVVAAGLATVVTQPLPPPIAAALALAASALVVVSALRLMRDWEHRGVETTPRTPPDARTRPGEPGARLGDAIRSRASSGGARCESS